MPEEARKGSKPGPRGDKPPGKSDSPRGPRFPGNFFLLALLLLLVGAILYISFVEKTQTLSYNEFQKLYWKESAKRYEGLSAGKLKDDVLLIKPFLPPESKAAESKSGRNPAGWYIVRLPSTAIDGQMLQHLGTIEGFAVESGDTFMRWVLYTTVPLLIVTLVFYLVVIRPLRGQGGAGNVLAFGRSRPKIINKEHTGIRFDDVAGIDEAKAEVTEVIEFLRNPAKFAKLGGRIPRGILFVGPPGTGKTLLAKAIAGEADVPFYSISGSDFVEMFVGVGASRVRDLFRQAKDHSPCIVFLDEVDAVGRRRGSGLGGGHDEREQTLNAILVEMDGFDTNEQVIVIAATNRPDTLDPALLRPGRFDREIVISLPEVKGRLEILKVHARNVKMSDEVDLSRIARATPMFSGAELEALINEAAIRAAMLNKEYVEQDDLEESRDKVRFGRENRALMSHEGDLRETALHEAGHALLTRLLPHVEPLHKVTIIPRGRSLGSTMLLPERDRYNYSRRQLLGQIKVAFGGRIAEELFLGDVSSGCVQDIQQASGLARKMVCDFGMSELGPIRFANKEQQVFLGGEVTQPREFSEATAEQIDLEVKKIIDLCYREAEQLLRERQADVELLANALLKHETLSAQDVETILAAHDVDALARAPLVSRLPDDPLAAS